MSKLDATLSPTDFDFWGNLSAPTQDNLQPFVRVRTTSEEPDGDDVETDDVTLPSRNVIYFGPPGTGKTYHLCHDLFELFTRASARRDRRQWVLEEAAEMSWWKVVAASLLDGGSARVPDLVKHEFVVAKIATTNQANPAAMIWSMLQQHAFVDCEFVRYTNRTDPQLFRKDADSVSVCRWYGSA